MVGYLVSGHECQHTCGHIMYKVAPHSFRIRANCCSPPQREKLLPRLWEPRPAGDRCRMNDRSASAIILSLMAPFGPLYFGRGNIPLASRLPARLWEPAPAGD